MRVFSTLMSWSNENKSCMRVDEREFVREFSHLSCPGQTRTTVVVCMFGALIMYWTSHFLK